MSGLAKPCQNEIKSAAAGLRGIHPPKPMMHIVYSLYFPKKCFPLFPQNLYIFPYISAKFMFLGLIYGFLLPPYFDHDAFMHHALHVPDTPGRIKALDRNW